MFNYLKQDSYLLGVVMAVLLPVVIYGVMHGIIAVLESTFSNMVAIKVKHLVLLAIMLNLLPMRSYLISYKYDKTGRGILAVTFVYMIVFFVFFH
ncbi:MAG: hypothetical protein K9J27_10060 [Bacteroidales bacterium]|nr:hypothetical protein [Bacteroidales bacterium]MCF8334108.1 hypothetical protein [Bacteroidales bacterium]